MPLFIGRDGEPPLSEWSKLANADVERLTDVFKELANTDERKARAVGLAEQFVLNLKFLAATDDSSIEDRSSSATKANRLDKLFDHFGSILDTYGESEKLERDLLNSNFAEIRPQSNLTDRQIKEREDLSVLLDRALFNDLRTKLDDATAERRAQLIRARVLARPAPLDLEDILKLLPTLQTAAQKSADDIHSQPEMKKKSGPRVKRLDWEIAELLDDIYTALTDLPASGPTVSPSDKPGRKGYQPNLDKGFPKFVGDVNDVLGLGINSATVTRGDLRRQRVGSKSPKQKWEIFWAINALTASR